MYKQAKIASMYENCVSCLGGLMGATPCPRVTHRLAEGRYLTAPINRAQLCSAILLFYAKPVFQRQTQTQKPCLKQFHIAINYISAKLYFCQQI